MSRGINQIISILGFLAAGAGYIPINVNQPLSRRERIYSKSDIKFAITDTRLKKELEWPETVTVLDVMEADAYDPLNTIENYPDSNTAYVIFTSGSTGEPKGVVMSHTAAQNTLISIENMYNISEEDTILGIADLSFDLSVFDIFSVLGVGGTLVLPNPEKGPDASHWGRLLNEYKVTLWNSVPAQAEMLDAFASKSESYPTVRFVLLSGD